MTKQDDKSVEPFQFSKCTLQVSIVLLPEDDDPAGRQIVLSAWSHENPPILRSFRQSEIGNRLQQIIREMLQQLREELPQRYREYLQEQEDKKKSRKPKKDTKKEAEESGQMSLFRQDGEEKKEAAK